MSSRTSLKLCLCVGLLTAAFTFSVQAEWKPVPGNIMTPWAEKVSPAMPLPEYPRPQMVREEWTNLNGLWSYAITEREAAQPGQFNGEILVPFCVESALSGVKKSLSSQQRLWYRRPFSAPELAKDGRLLLHFGAVDWEATVSVNGKLVGVHRGGYTSFSFDITDATKATGQNELVVSVVDPTNKGHQPVGKQSLTAFGSPGGVWYSPCSGIWQTVWLEAVVKNHIESLKIEPDVDSGLVRVTVHGGGESILVTALDSGKVVAQGAGKSGESIALKIADAKLWSPDSPFLYDLKVESGNDQVTSYFGMRKISIGKDENGVTRPLLNNRFVFQSGPLDQGYWPDGIYTAPTDEALKFDLEITKKLGFNMTRKHAKVEPARWYYWCDRLGLLVWQDMPSGRAGRGKKPEDPALRFTPVSDQDARQFEGELKAMVAELFNSPSVIMWTVFNEGWGQYNTERITEMVKTLDSSRLINNASGWTDFKVGDVIDIHRYPNPGTPKLEENRAAVLGEFGGLGLKIEEHLWSTRKPFVYRNISDQVSFNREYQRLWIKVGQQAQQKGLSAAVYTQITDVECELNGLMTYDRKVIKAVPENVSVAGFARGEYPKLPVLKEVFATSAKTPATWRYTTDQPAETWFQPDFDDAAWSQGQGGFGTINNETATSRTPWRTTDIWLRREFELPEKTWKNLIYNLFHDEKTEIYINGVHVMSVEGYNKEYSKFPLSEQAATTLKPGRNVIAVHCRQTAGMQYIDVGIAEEEIAAFAK